MYNTRRDVPHNFSLAGMNIGDWFMGCPECGLQYPTRSAGPASCNCGGTLLIYDIKPHNVAEILHQELVARQKCHA